MEENKEEVNVEEKLEVISGIYNSDIADKNKNITKEVLEQEKIKYKKERESSRIH